MIKILLGGSPCTHWSIAQRADRRETTASGKGWELFRNYLIAKEKFKPDFFLYENNCSASTEIKEQIERELGVKRMEINSALVSAQMRKRFYCFNWTVEQPEDRGIKLQDILENGVDLTGNEKAWCLTTRYRGAWIKNTLERKQRNLVAEPIRVGDIGSNAQAHRVYSVKGKSICLSANGGGQGGKTGLYQVPLEDGEYIIRKLTPVECERLQTLPDNYTEGVSKTQRYKMLGNGWTAEVIIHILNGILKDVPRDERLVVLSMYDGLGTGRYCLDKLGFKNVEYHAYEIDKYAIKVALKNYPDIIEHGDAFQMREENAC